MYGVEILAMEEVAVEFAFNWTACLIAVFSIFVFMVAVGTVISIASYDWSNIGIGIIFGILFGILLGVLTGNALETPTEYATQYKVIISDEVSLNDFNDKYEIVDQDGKIYIVRERN